MKQRLSDLDDFVDVLKDLNIVTDMFENIQGEMKRRILKAHKNMSELIPSDMFHSIFNG